MSAKIIPLPARWHRPESNHEPANETERLFANFMKRLYARYERECPWVLRRMSDEEAARVEEHFGKLLK